MMATTTVYVSDAKVKSKLNMLKRVIFAGNGLLRVNQKHVKY